MEDIKKEIKQNEVIDIGKDVVGQSTSFLIKLTVITLILLLLSGGWYLASKNSLKRSQDQIADVNSELTKFSSLEKQLIDFQGAVDNISSAMSQKKKVSGVFNELNKVIPNDIVLTGFSLDETKKVKIDGQAPNLSAAARAIVAFSKDKEDNQKPNSVFKNVALSAFSLQSGKINFSLTMDAGGSK